MKENRKTDALPQPERYVRRTEEIQSAEPAGSGGSMKKMRHMRRLTAALLIFSVAWTGIFFLGGCSGISGKPVRTQGEGTPAVVDVTGEMETEFLDVGKADCIVIQTSSQTAVIDTGYDDTLDDVTEYLDSEGIKKIDHLFLTHFDKDHVGGASGLVENYEIGTVYQPDYSADEEDSKHYRRYEEALHEKDIHPVTVKEALGIVMDDVVFTVYPPEKLEYDKDKDNNRSLVIAADHGSVRMLFAGDAEKERIEEIMTQIADLDFDLLKVPHHGRMEKNSEEFFEAVSPEYAVICAEEEGKEDAAEEETVEALQKAGAEVFVTGSGDITCRSDGEGLAVTQEQSGR